MNAESIFRTRRYLHFDEPIGPRASEALATNAQRVATWSFLPMLSCTISIEKVKRNNGRLLKKVKSREISYSAHKDAAIYSYYGFLLSCAYEQELYNRGLEPVVTAFRPESGRCNIHFAKEAFQWIASQNTCTVLAFDIKGFFDNLDHRHLKKQWAALLGQQNLPDDHYAVYKSLTRYSTVDRNEAFKALGISQHKPRAHDRKRLCSPTDFRKKIRDAGLISRNQKGFGIPQGSPMSAVLSNIYLLPFDAELNKMVLSMGGFYRRYRDDILCIVSPIYADQVQNFIYSEIKSLKLEVQVEKTTKHHFIRSNEKMTVDASLQYLGFLYDGNRVLLRPSGLSRFYTRMRRGVKLAAASRRKNNDSGQLIRRKKLNIKYSYLGGRNYIAYAMRAARELSSVSIKKQVRRHWGKLNDKVAAYNTLAGLSVRT